MASILLGTLFFFSDHLLVILKQLLGLIFGAWLLSRRTTIALIITAWRLSTLDSCLISINDRLLIILLWKYRCHNILSVRVLLQNQIGLGIVRGTNVATSSLSASWLVGSLKVNCDWHSAHTFRSALVSLLTALIEIWLLHKNVVELLVLIWYKLILICYDVFSGLRMLVLL